MTRWRRLHRVPGYYRALFAGIGFLVCMAIALAVIGALRHDFRPVPFTLTVLGAFALSLYAIRRYTTGVFVSDRGFRIRQAFQTDKYNWSDIAALEVRQSEDTPLVTLGWRSLWVVSTDGAAVETNLVRGEYYVAEAELRAQWTNRLQVRQPPAPGLYLPNPMFDSVVSQLRTDFAQHAAVS
jgi:hypothetical protein